MRGLEVFISLSHGLTTTSLVRIDYYHLIILRQLKLIDFNTASPLQPSHLKIITMASEADEFDAFIASQPAPEDLDSTMGDRQESQAFNFVDDQSLPDASLPTGSPFAARADEDMTEVAGSERPFVNGTVLETVEEAQTEKEPTPVSRHLRATGTSRQHSLNPRSVSPHRTATITSLIEIKVSNTSPSIVPTI